MINISIDVNNMETLTAVLTALAGQGLPHGVQAPVPVEAPPQQYTQAPPPMETPPQQYTQAPLPMEAPSQQFVQAPPPVTHTAQEYGLADMQKACSQLMDVGKGEQLKALLVEFGVPALTSLTKEQYTPFVVRIRQLGATI